MIDINVSAEIRFQDIRKNQSFTDGRTHRQTDGQCENSIPHHKQSWGGGIIRTRWLYNGVMSPKDADWQTVQTLIRV